MRSVTGDGAPLGRYADHAEEHPQDTCRWCGGPSAWTWTVEPDPDTGAVGRSQAPWSVCGTCQDLTLAGDDAGLLDRHMATLTARLGYPVAVDFLRDEAAAGLARWIVRRASFRALDHGALR